MTLLPSEYKQFRAGVQRDSHWQGRKLTLTQNQLMSGVGNLSSSIRNPREILENLRGFHKDHLSRIAALHASTEDPIQTASQLAGLRRVLAIQAFRLAATEHPGNYALALGGSAIKGDNTFFTDLDLIVIPYGEADKEPALNTKKLMCNILNSIYIENDELMPMRFANETLKELEQDNFLCRKSELPKSSNLALWMGDVAFYSFLMDVEIIDAKGSRKKSEYQQLLKELQDATIYSRPLGMIDLCWEAEQQLKEPPREPYNSTPFTFKIKNEALRPFYRSTNAIRAKLGIRESSPWEILDSLAQQKIITEEERQNAQSAFNFFLDLRHRIGLYVSEATDLTVITEASVPILAKSLNISSEKLTENIEISARILRQIADKLFACARNGNDTTDT